MVRSAFSLVRAGVLALFCLALAPPTAQADQIVGFGQLGTTNVFLATNNGDGTTSLDAFAFVNITNIIEGAPDPFAVFEFEAESVGAASLLAGTVITQQFEGTFTLRNSLDTFDYLTGSFGAALMLGGNGGTGSLFTSNTAGLAPLTFSTDLSVILADPRSFGLSLSNVDPSLGISCGPYGGNCTINSFTASFTGTADAQLLEEVPVPEPGSLILLGSGLLGLGSAVRKRFRRLA